MDWTIDEELTISGIMGTETMHDPENSSGGRRIQCTRIEAIRRMRRRTVAGTYVAPIAVVLEAATIPLAAEPTRAQLAVLEAGRQKAVRQKG
jgi:hypothetical protein